MTEQISNNRKATGTESRCLKYDRPTVTTLNATPIQAYCESNGSGASAILGQLFAYKCKTGNNVTNNACINGPNDGHPRMICIANGANTELSASPAGECNAVGSTAAGGSVAFCAVGTNVV